MEPTESCMVLANVIDINHKFSSVTGMFNLEMLTCEISKKNLWGERKKKKLRKMMSGFPPKIDKIYKPEDSRGSAQLNYKEIDRRYIIIKNWWKKANLRKWQEVA